MASAAFIARIRVEKQRVASYLIRAARGTLAYATIGGENVVKVYTAGDKPDQVATIPAGALPHGAWASDDGSRMPRDAASSPKILPRYWKDMNVAK